MTAHLARNHSVDLDPSTDAASRCYDAHATCPARTTKIVGCKWYAQRGTAPPVNNENPLSPWHAPPAVQCRPRLARSVLQRTQRLTHTARIVSARGLTCRLARNPSECFFRISAYANTPMKFGAQLLARWRWPSPVGCCSYESCWIRTHAICATGT